MDGDGFIIPFVTEVDAVQSTDCIARQYDVPAFYDLDAVQAWCRSDSRVVDCDLSLRTWNLVTDLPERSELFTAADSRANALYDKLFHGCNVPAMASGEPYVPSWTTPQVLLLKQLLLLGLAELRARFRT